MPASRSDGFLLALTLALAAGPALAQAAPPLRLGPPQNLVAPSPPAGPKPGPAVAAPTTAPSAATPATPAETVIQAAPLAPLDPDWSGPLGPEQGGLTADLWADTPRALVSAALPRIGATSSPALQDLARRLLLSNATAPAGKDPASGPGLLALRLERILALGRLEGAQAVLDAVPSQGRDADVDRIAIEIQLLSGQRDEACQQVAQGIRKHSGLWWQRALIACQAINGEKEKAALGLALLREQKVPRDAAFDALVTGLPDGGAKLKALPEPTVLDLALLQAGKAPPPKDLASSDSPSVLRAVALDAGTPPVLRIAASERAAAFGALPLEKLRAVYENASFTAAERANALSRGAADKGPHGRALLYVAAKGEKAPAAQAELVQAFLAQAQAGGEYLLAARTIEPVLSGIAPSPDLAWFAADAARALLAAGKYPAARAWTALAKPDAAPRLFVLERLAQGDGGAAWDAELLHGFLQGALKGDVETGWRQSAMVLSLLAALGDPIAPADWVPLLGLPQPAPPPAGSAPILVELTRAAAAKRLGETVLLALVGLEQGDRLTQNPAVLARAVSALCAVGLEADARALAVEAALASGV